MVKAETVLFSAGLCPLLVFIPFLALEALLGLFLRAKACKGLTGILSQLPGEDRFPGGVQNGSGCRCNPGRGHRRADQRCPFALRGAGATGDPPCSREGGYCGPTISPADTSPRAHLALLQPPVRFILRLVRPST